MSDSRVPRSPVPPYEALDGWFVPSASLPPGRTAWETRGGWDAATHLAVFLDAELYLERVGALAALAEPGAPPAVFVSCVDSAARHRDYACREEQAAFLVEELLPAIRGRHPGVAAVPVVLVGLSLSGLAAAHAMLARPGVFAAAICQSPSMWWEKERFAASLLPGAPPARFRISVGTGETERGVSHEPTGLRQEASQIDSCRRAARALEERGHEVLFRTFEGGHDPACWGGELGDALRWARGVRGRCRRVGSLNSRARVLQEFPEPG